MGTHNDLTPIKSRIVGYDTKPADQFNAHPHNWRKHPMRQREAVAASLRELGWIAPVIENRQTGNLIDGHERVWQALQRGEDVPYMVVDLSPEEEALALATFDAITGMAETDAEALDRLLAEVSTGEAALMELVASLALDAGLMAREMDTNYSRKIDPPIYEPKGKQPAISDLYDTSKTIKLVQAIEAANLPDDLAAFLIAAAQRHTVIKFDLVAEYYAHAAADVQRLMEDSALVIIDFDRAIELGFVEMTEAIARLAGEELGDG